MIIMAFAATAISVFAAVISYELFEKRFLRLKRHFESLTQSAPWILLTTPSPATSDRSPLVRSLLSVWFACPLDSRCQSGEADITGRIGGEVEIQVGLSEEYIIASRAPVLAALLGHSVHSAIDTTSIAGMVVIGTIPELRSAQGGAIRAVGVVLNPVSTKIPKRFQRFFRP